jgi:hypothetical protein
MLILYIAAGAFILGGGIFFLTEMAPQRSTRKWY